MKRIKNFFKRDFSTNRIEYNVLQKMLKENANIILLDVRNILEFEESHLVGALNIPLGELEKKVELLIPNKGQTIIIYCNGGVKSKVASEMLIEMGYINVYELKGGLDCI